MVHLDVPFLSDEEIKDFAKNFTFQYNFEDVYPVPIEEIVEFKFNINIIPVPSLQTICDIDAFTSSDYSCIYVDDFILQNRYPRYRFSLAHEMGHISMHSGILQSVSANITDINSWTTFVTEVDKKEYDKMEYQAYAFAGYVLIPPAKLKSAFENILPLVEPLINEAKNKHISRDKYLFYAIESAATRLTSVFEASPEAICKRIKKDGLAVMIP